ncbi:MAG: PEGA domain-containing protein [Terriglobia bacterium]
MSDWRVWLLAVVGAITVMPTWAASVRVPDGTPVPLQLKAELSSGRAEVGQRVDFAVAHAVNIGGVVAIPEGSIAWGAVQSVKRGKEVKFDVQGLRLPNLREMKLRSVREKTSNPAKDQIKIETRLGDGVGAAVGTEFTAYIDGDVDVEAAGAPTTVPSALPATSPPPETKPAAHPPPQPVTVPAVSAPTRSPSQTAPAPSSPASAATQASRPPAQSTAAVKSVQTPQASAPVPKAASTPAAQETAVGADRVTVECFSDPTGAEIMLNDEYYGNTPSILKLLPAVRRLDLKMPGYKTDSQTLDLTQGGAFRTVRGTLEKKE